VLHGHLNLNSKPKEETLTRRTKKSYNDYTTFAGTENVEKIKKVWKSHIEGEGRLRVFENIWV